MSLKTAAPMALPGSGLTIATVDGHVILGGTIAVGDVLPLPCIGIGTSALSTGVNTASAAQRKSAIVCVALEAGSSGQRIRVRIQGRCKALTKSITGNAIAVGDRLTFGTGKAFDADTPLANTNRWVAYADEAVAAVTSATAAVRDVILMGPNGLGMQAPGT